MGGLGGLAMKYEAGQSVGAAIAARDAKWELSAGQHGQSAALAVPQVDSCAFLRARLAALGSSALPGRGRPTGRPATALRARASRLQSRRFPRL